MPGASPPLVSTAIRRVTAASLLLLHALVEHLDEALRVEKALAPGLVEFGGGLGVDHLRERPSALHLLLDPSGNRREHVAKALQVGLGRERAAARDDLPIVARHLQRAVRVA